ncbi:MAG: hypothetical protein CMN28_07255 [Salinisphaeraceae bacterium]|nr:hypothetical protein [Salinisphaeraceae bacterium]
MKQPIVSLNRRRTLRALYLGAGALSLPQFLAACGGGGSGGDSATVPTPGTPSGPSAPTPLGPAGSSQLNIPTGPLARIPALGAMNADGAAIPEVSDGGEPFRIRVVARAGAQPAISRGSVYLWHTFPDGGATYPLDNGGWVYVSNSEVPAAGGVGALAFDPPASESDDAPIAAAYPILLGTSVNCAGGKTPWQTWLSCEEFDFSADLPIGVAGQVWETNPYGSPLEAVPKPALGRFSHEAAVVDIDNRTVYLTEDQGDGRFYRFVADASDLFTDGNGQPRLRMEAGTLQVMNIQGFENGGYPDQDSQLQQLTPVSWVDVQSPGSGQAAVRAGMTNPPGTVFDGGEGLWFYELPVPLATPAGGTVPTTRLVYFSTKGDNRIWALDIDNQLVELVFDNTQIAPDFNDVDNVTISPWGDILVAEDGAMQRIMVVIPNVGARVLSMTGHEGSEITGPAFSPDGSRLYFSSQRGPGAGATGSSGNGVTFELYIPPQFRGAAPG